MFAIAVREHRRRLGLSQEELASRTGLSVRTVGKLEAGRIAAPRAATVRLLADAFRLAGAERDRFCQAANPPAEARPVNGAGRTGRPVPAQLPADVPGFVGRRSELDRLSALAAKDGGQTVIVTAIGGTAGVGKTALAVHWAHLARSRFPDGQLYVNLCGYDSEQPMSAADALAGFLRTLGMPGNEVPLDADERAAAYRSLLDGRRILVVLDNACAVDQVRPLLPGSPTCATVVTSRDSLCGLVARDGASRIDLDLLPPDEALDLLGALVGDRVGADPAAAATLARQCAHLPLALRVAAELAVARPSAPLANLVEELADERNRLDLLDAGGDARTGVSAVLSWSYRQLLDPAARMFRLLGAHPGMDFDRYAAAAIAGVTVPEAAGLLRRLNQASMIHPLGMERYGMHDLLRAYANHRAEQTDPEPERHASMDRLLEHYQHGAAAAMATMHPSEPHRRVELEPSSLPVPDLSSPADALAWLDAERANLLATAAYAVHNGWPEHSIRLGLILFRYLDVRGHVPDALRLHGLARDAARLVGDLAGESRALTSLAVAYGRLGRLHIAEDALNQAVDRGHRSGDAMTEHIAIHNLACVYWLKGDYAEAVEHFRRALEMGVALGDSTTLTGTRANLAALYFRLGEYAQSEEVLTEAIRLLDEVTLTHGEVQARSNLAELKLRLGRVEEAADSLAKGLLIARTSGDLIAQSVALIGLGELDLTEGRAMAAIERLREALVILWDVGYRQGEATALSLLGVALHRCGDFPQAIEAHERAVKFVVAAVEPGLESECRNRYAETLHLAGRPDEAAEQYGAALTLAAHCGDPYQQAVAHAGLGSVHHGTGSMAEARQCWRTALEIFEQLGVPDADRTRRRLTSLGEQTVDHLPELATPRVNP